MNGSSKPTATTAASAVAAAAAVIRTPPNSPRESDSKSNSKADEESDTDEKGNGFTDFEFFDGLLSIPIEVDKSKASEFDEFSDYIDEIECEAINLVLELFDCDRKVDNVFTTKTSLVQLLLLADKLGVSRGAFDNVTRVFMHTIRHLIVRVLRDKHQLEYVPVPLKLYEILEEEYNIDPSHLVEREEQRIADEKLAKDEADKDGTTPTESDEDTTTLHLGCLRLDLGLDVNEEDPNGDSVEDQIDAIDGVVIDTILEVLHPDKLHDAKVNADYLVAEFNKRPLKKYGPDYADEERRVPYDHAMEVFRAFVTSFPRFYTDLYGSGGITNLVSFYAAVQQKYHICMRKYTNIAKERMVKVKIEEDEEKRIAAKRKREQEDADAKADSADAIPEPSPAKRPKKTRRIHSDSDDDEDSSYSVMKKVNPELADAVRKAKSAVNMASAAPAAAAASK